MWIFLLIFCIVFLIALTNIYVVAIFDETGFFGYIRILFFKIAFSKDGKSKKDISMKRKEKDKDKKPGKLSELKLIIEPALRALGKLVRYVCIRNFNMNITVGTGDAFSTAMLYGGASAGIGMIFPVLNQNLKIKKKCINVMADFGASESTVYMDITASVTVWQILVIAYVFAVQYLKKIIKIRKDDKNGRTRIE